MFEEEIWEKTSISSDYEVSNHGRFRSLTRTVSVMSGYKKVLEGKDLKPFDVHTTGYLQINIRGKKYAAHRLVAMAFCDGYADGLVVNHKNGNKKDNRAENLEWTTPSNNLRHAYSDLGVIPNQLGRFGEDHNSSKAVIATCRVTGQEVRYAAAMDAVRDGFDSGCISRCCTGQSSYHKGYNWRFEGERNE